MRIRFLALSLATVLAAAAQNYSGPFPPKTDLPYLKHASTLLPTEESEAKEEKGKKEEIIYAVPGAASSARTPLASPIFLLQTEKVVAAKLELYRLEPRNGRRELVVSPKKPAKTIRVNLTRLNNERLYRLEVNESLEAGEYALSAEGSNQVFCFQVY